MAKVPPHAQKVFSGTIFDVYQWPQQLFDGSEATYEMVRRRPTVDIVVVLDNKILTIEQEQPGRSLYPGIPGGKIDDGEEPLAAAERELKEETGYTADSFSLIGDYNTGSKIDFQNYVFRAVNPQKTHEQHLDGGEKIRLKFLSFADFLQLTRNQKMTVPLGLRFEMFEALLDENKKAELKKKLGLA